MALTWHQAAVFVLSLAVPSAFADEAAMTKRATELKEAPGSGRTLEQLAAQAPVTRLDERKGAWVRVRTAQGTTGWVHMFELAASGSAVLAEGSGTGGGSAARAVASFFGGGSTRTGTSASGIRGLDEETLKAAVPNQAALAQLPALRVNERDAQAFAQRAALQRVDVPELPAGARPSSTGSGSAPGGTPQ
jgi:hypothetical protein